MHFDRPFAHLHDEEPLLHTNVQFFSATDCRGTKLAGDDGGMTGGTTATGQNAFGRNHAVNIIGLGLRAHHDHRFALFGPLFGRIGIKDGHADCGARAGVDRFFNQQVTGILRRFFNFTTKLGVEQHVNLSWFDAHQRGFLVDQTFGDHVNSDLDLGAGGALAITGLQHPEFALFNRKLYILHLVEMIFQLVTDVDKLGIGCGQFPLELADRRGVANPSDHIFALGVD